MDSENEFEVQPRVSATKASPPRARLVLRVGVTGHRPNNLKSAEPTLLLARIHAVLGFLREAALELHSEAGSIYLPDLPIVRVISPIAEGADRLVAVVAMSQRFELQCPLPFSIEEYVKDFASEESQSEFYELLGKATAILELDGSRDPPDRQDQSYESVGRMVLNQSDVILAIWDGRASGKRGGTSQIVGEALRLGLPLVWIDSRQPHSIQMQVKPGEWKSWESGSESLYERLKDLLLPPEIESRQDKESTKPDLREVYFSERKRNLTLGFFWRVFRNLIAEERFGKIFIKLPDFEESTEREWGKVSEISPQLPERVVDEINTRLRSHYSWADQLADYYANIYRSAFVFNYLMSAFAVLFAFLTFASHNSASPDKRLARVFNSSEFLIVLSILVFTYLGTKRRWHERWIDYRLLAEQLRQMRFLMTLGRVSLSPSGLPAHASYGDPRDSWMSWHLRATIREGGMVNARFEGDYLRAVGAFLNEEGIKGQIAYHDKNALLLENMNHRLHVAGVFLFAAAFVAVILHFFFHEGPFSFALTLMTIVGPAFGAALVAIRGQGEFDRVTRRSRAMSSHLQRISTRLEQLIKNHSELSSLSLGDIAVAAAQLMIDEVLDWRLVFQERPLELPG
jgi:hypothetical protein